MCCLTFENEIYQQQLKKLPKTGKKVNTKKGRGKVIRQNVINCRFTILTEDGSEADVGIDEIIKDN